MKFVVGDRIVTKLTSQHGVVVRVIELTRAEFDRLHIRTGRRVIIVDSDMCEPDTVKSMLSFPQILELAQRRANVDKRMYCIIFCSSTGYNIMTPEKAKKNGSDIRATVEPQKA